MGWSWAGGLAGFISPSVWFLGLAICTVGALWSARGAHGATRKDRASARAAATLAVLLLLVPAALVAVFILLFATSDGPFFG
jgi:hypothetical protein